MEYNATNYTTFSATDAPGNDITNYISSLEDCRLKCESKPTCKGFNFSRDRSSDGKGICWIKNDVSNKIPTSSWTLYERKEGTTFMATDVPGNDITHLENASLDHCKATCRKTDGCTAYNFPRQAAQSGSLGTCWLKRNITNANPTVSTLDWNLYPLNDTYYTLYSESDAPGNDMYHLDNMSFSTCKQNCDTDPTCKGFNFPHTPNANGKGTCWYKNNVNRPGGKYVGTPDWDLFVKNPRYTFSYKSDTPGHDLGYLNNASYIDCKNACDNDPNCKGFNFPVTPNNGRGTCWLKNYINTYTTSNNWNLYTKN
jgi:hypothetical protein